MGKRPGEFWKTTPLKDMDGLQWESLCDGCGKCCLHKIHFEEEDELAYTRVACRHLDTDSCRCACYGERSELNPVCIVLTPENLGETAPLLPETCAYRLIHEDSDLPWWHPLVSGDPDAVHTARMSVRGRVVPEDEVSGGDLEDYIIDWA